MQYWRSKSWSLQTEYVTVRLLYLIVQMFVSFMLEIVEIHRVDLQHDDDNVEVLNWETTPRFFQCLSASHALQLLETDSVFEVRVADLTRNISGV